MIIMDSNVEEFLSLSLADIVQIKCPPEISNYFTGAAFSRFNQSVGGDVLSLFQSESDSSPNFIVANNHGVNSNNISDHLLFAVTSSSSIASSDWSPSLSMSSVPTPAGSSNNILLNNQHSSISRQQQEDMQRLKYYSYGIALPAICILGILGNVLNLIVLTRPSMRGPAYVYMRGKIPWLTWCITKTLL